MMQKGSCVKQLFMRIALMWLVCCLFPLTVGNAEDVNPVVAILPDGQAITLSEVLPLYSQYALVYEQYGIEESEYREQLLSEALSSVIAQRQLAKKAAELGCDQLTEEEWNTVRDAGQKTFEEEIEAYAVQFKGLSDVTDEAERAQILDEVKALYAEEGITEAYYTELLSLIEMIDKMRDGVYQGISVTDVEFEEYLATEKQLEKEAYQDNPEGYDAAMGFFMEQQRNAQIFGKENSAHQPLYRPEGIRGIRTILIGVQDMDLLRDYLQARRTYQEQQADESAVENTVTQEALEEKRQAVLAYVAVETEEILQKHREGESFTVLLDAYGNDPIMRESPYREMGYELFDQSERFEESFMKAAFMLKNVGDISEPVVTSKGVEILEFTAELPAGEVEMPSDQQETLRKQFLQSKQSNAYTQVYAQWISAEDVKYTGVITSLADMLSGTQTGEP